MNPAKTIVKVQLSLASSDGVRMVLIYDESRKNTYQGPADEEIIKEMAGEDKKFYWAKVPKKPGYIILLGEAPWQDW